VLLLLVVDAGAVLDVFPAFAQEPFLQFLPHDFMHALLHLASFEEVEAVCCPKAKPVIPIRAAAIKSFFIMYMGFKR
jgi:hypothetical protein